MMFELSATVLERIIFAMEDQTKSMLIDLESGELVPRDSATVPADSERLVAPPEWTPADGFKLMESFCSKVRNVEIKHALMRALSHGKGVFKAFRTVLAASPEDDLLFREFKNARLRRYVESWVDDQREALGLARLGPEPEEFPDLVDEEFTVEKTRLSEAPFDIAKLVGDARSESSLWLPAVMASLEEAEVRGYVGARGGEAFLHYFPDAQGSPNLAPIGAAFGSMETAGGRPVGVVRFLYSSRDFRDLGLDLRLLDSLHQRFRAAGAEQTVVKTLFLVPGLASQLEARGSRVMGYQYLME
jgi:hypothetical protein